MHCLHQQEQETKASHTKMATGWLQEKTRLRSLRVQSKILDSVAGVPYQWQPQ
jgi:hypothetical protein